MANAYVQMESIMNSYVDIPERIVCAANKYGDQVIAGVRHGCDAMCDSLETSNAYHAIKKQVHDWDIESQLPYYREGHSCSDAVSELQDIMTNEGMDIPEFKRDEEIQGFLTSKYRFVDRHEAWKIAESQGQILRRVPGDDKNGGKLFSENMY